MILDPNVRDLEAHFENPLRPPICIQEVSHSGYWIEAAETLLKEFIHEELPRGAVI